MEVHLKIRWAPKLDQTKSKNSWIDGLITAQTVAALAGRWGVRILSNR